MELKAYQERTVQFALSAPYMLMALEMGLGKTLCALEMFNRLGSGQKLLVVCPSYLSLNWKSEVEKFYGDKYSVTIFSKGKDLSLPTTDIAIVSYDLAQKAEYLFAWATVVVADEANYLKAMSAKRTSFFHKAIFENSVPRLLLLTGTPIQNRVEEFYSLISLCNYSPALNGSKFLDVYPDAVSFADRYSFRQEYEIMVRNRRVKIIKWTGVQREAELHGWLKGIYIRFKSSEELGLEPIIYKDILISESKNLELLAEFGRFSSDNHSVKPDIKARAAKEKVPFTVTYVKDLYEQIDSPIMIYTDHRESAHMLAGALDCKAITGEMSGESRMKLATEFQAGIHKFLVATIGSFSTGVTLTRANNLVLNDFCWTPGLLSQVEYRINRIGQTKQCLIHRILGSPQDALILRALESKSKVIERVV